jgi:KDO2-lipid IV(A) lauroyltransferase
MALHPRCIRYGVYKPMVAFILRKVARYRFDVITNQLRESFPEKSEEEIADIRTRYYNHLAEMVIDTLSLAGINEKRRRKETEFNLPDDFHKQIEGRDVVAYTSHYGFWEIALNLYLETPNHRVVGAYRPIKSVIVNKLFRRLRNNDEVDIVPSHQFMRHFLLNRNKDGKNLIAGLIADQNCPPTKGCCWHRFLNHDSLFFDGGEHLAVKYHLPVYYLELERLEAGRYRHNFTLLYDGVEDIRPHEITERYVRCLERTIKAKPEYWMWSHRRWKYCPDANAKFYDNYKEQQ